MFEMRLENACIAPTDGIMCVVSLLILIIQSEWSVELNRRTCIINFINHYTYIRIAKALIQGSYDTLISAMFAFWSCLKCECEGYELFFFLSSLFICTGVIQFISSIIVLVTRVIYLLFLSSFTLEHPLQPSHAQLPLTFNEFICLKLTEAQKYTLCIRNFLNQHNSCPPPSMFM